MHISTLRPAFYGVASADIVYGSNLLKVKPTELLPNVTGQVDTSVTILSTPVTTRKGIVEKKVIISDFINCTWFSRNTNRGTPPDVMKGERILVWRDADSEKYYWESTGIDTHLRTTEHVIMFFSNTNPEDRKDKVLGFDNCYIIEVDTKGKKVGIHTNKNDGEPLAWDLQLNTGEGFFKINDDVGDHVLIDGVNTLIEMVNKEGTRYALNKKDIEEYAPGNRTLIVDGNNTTTVKGNNTTTTTGNVTVTTEGSNTETITGTNTITAPSTTYDTAMTVVTSVTTPILTATTSMSAAGACTAGSMEATGAIVGGSISSKGSISGVTGNFSGAVSASNI